MSGRPNLAAALIALIALPVAAAPNKDPQPAYTGPTEADIRAAYQARLDWVNEGTRKYLNEKAAAQLQIHLIRLSLIECNPLEENPSHSLCSVLVDAGLGEQVSEAKRVELVMQKDGDVWKIQ